MTKKPQLYIAQDAYDRLRAYIRLCPLEITGFGTGELKDGVVQVDRVFIYKQDVSAGHADLDTAAFGDALYELIADGGNPEDVCLWWHSHATMQTFMSGTDNKTAETFKVGRDWMTTLVGNHAGNWHAEFHLYRPVRAVLEMEVLRSIDKDLEKEVITEIVAKVSESWGGGGDGREWQGAGKSGKNYGNLSHARGRYDPTLPASYRKDWHGGSKQLPPHEATIVISGEEPETDEDWSQWLP